MIVSGSLGSIRIWLKYIGRGFSSLTFFHDAPLSSDRYTPVGVAGVTVVATLARPAGCGAASSGVAGAPRPPRPLSVAGPSITAYRTFERLRYTSMPMRPSGPSGKPLPFTRVHVSPASVDFQRPLPGPPP